MPSTSNQRNDRKRQVGSGVTDDAPANKRARCEEICTESDLKGTHIIIFCDVSALNQSSIILPPSLEEKINELDTQKIQFGLNVELEKDEKIKTWRLSNSAVKMSTDFIEKGIAELYEKLSKYTERGSGWRIKRIMEINLKITPTVDMMRLSGRSYIPTPKNLSMTKAVVNVQNEDNLCFIYAILAIQKYAEIVEHRTRPIKYIQFFKTLIFNPIQMPMKLCDIPRFEKENGLTINVFSYNNQKVKEDEEVFKHPFISLIFRSSQVGEPINLLLLENNNKFHYIGVSNLNRLLNLSCSSVSKTRIQNKWCPKCVNGFQRIEAFEKHLPICNRNKVEDTLYVMPIQKELSFKDWHKSISPPFIIYADFESILSPDEIHLQKHVPCAAGVLLLPKHDPSKRIYREFKGPDCVLAFLRQIEEWCTDIITPFFWANYNRPMIALTPDEQRNFFSSSSCYMCSKPFSVLVRDHDHFTGRFLGAACNSCNLARRLPKFVNVPVIFHNLRGYDMHHILKYAINMFPSWNISCIPQSSEKFIALIARKNKFCIKFIDSYQFLNSSLAKLAKNVKDFPLTRSSFDSDFFQEKGIFPYDFAVSQEVLEKTEAMPPIWGNVSIDQYNRALMFWQRYCCRNLADYMMQYLKLDVLLLADIFEGFRTKVIAEETLDPVNFFSIPGMSWAVAIKGLKHNVEVLTDVEMYNFFESGIRGGMTFVNKHYVKTDAETSLLYIDINNLYGWALSQKLPCSNFTWESPDESILQDCFNLDLENLDYGYALEVDIEVPEALHDKLSDLPVAPESKCPPDSKVPKLLLTHEKKLNYVIHWRLLQCYLRLGIVVTKLHRAIRFKQESIFKEYILSNTRKRALAKSEFEKDYYKLLNNSLYGKSFENLKKRINLKLCNTEKRLMTYVNKPQFKRSIKIADNLIAVTLQKETVLLDRPSYIGQVVLDLSKLRMYELQYDELEKYRQQFDCKINIVAGDTDSFFLECKGVEREILLSAMKDDNLLDTSNYNSEHPLFSRNLEAMIGKFKDESKGVEYHEWIFLRPKCYSLWSSEKETMRAKGISIPGTGICHASYKKVYDEQWPLSVEQKRIGSITHQIYTFFSTKVALAPDDNKRFWYELNASVPYGHRKHLEMLRTLLEEKIH